jgi:hypothetical protein
MTGCGIVDKKRWTENPFCNTFIMLPLQGEKIESNYSLPRALPWAKLFRPYRPQQEKVRESHALCGTKLFWPYRPRQEKVGGNHPSCGEHTEERKQ